MTTELRRIVLLDSIVSNELKGLHEAISLLNLDSKSDSKTNQKVQLCAARVKSVFVNIHIESEYLSPYTIEKSKETVAAIEQRHIEIIRGGGYTKGRFFESFTKEDVSEALYCTKKVLEIEEDDSSSDSSDSASATKNGVLEKVSAVFEGFDTNPLCTEAEARLRQRQIDDLKPQNLRKGPDVLDNDFGL